MRISLRPVLIGLILLVAIVGLVRVLPNSSPQPTATGAVKVIDGSCTSEHPGVTLIADYGIDSGRAPLVKCALGFNKTKNSADDAASGWQLFDAADVAVEGTTEFPVGFVCRIDGYPTKADQPCTSTPTYSQGHWAYFYAQHEAGYGESATFGNRDSGRWLFSGAGASQHKPRCGSVEGWLFVKGDAVTGETTNTQPSVEPKAFRCEP